MSARQEPSKVWTPPLGIPTPDFGITESAPAAPSPWTAPVPGFYFVNNSARNATDANNPYGTPAQPRATIPTRLPAGSVVEVRGVYDQVHTSPNNIRVSGTRAQPVFIRGLSEAQKTDIVRSWEISGTYLVVEHLRFRPRDPVTPAALVMLSPLDHAVLRHSELTGNVYGGGLGVVTWTPATSGSDIVIWNNKIHDNGDVRANFDQDVHGIAVGSHISRLWVVDNQMWGNSGDGIQINAGTAGNQPTTHHIYVGRNISHHNKQNGFWTKQAVDVIFSQNVTYGNRPSNSSMGVGLGYQYAPQYVWFLFNHVYDSNYGIGSGSDSGRGTGTEIFVIGNLIHDIHDRSGGFNPNTAWHSCGVSLPGGTNRFVISNTIYDVDSGVCLPSPIGKAEIHNNFVFGTHPDGQHIFLEYLPSAAATRAAGNVFGPNYRAVTAGRQLRYDGAEVVGRRGENSVVLDPGFAAGTAQPFDLQAWSAAVDFGIDDPSGVYALFQQRYGLDIKLDFLGRPRPSGFGLDAGAFETPVPATRRR